MHISALLGQAQYLQRLLARYLAGLARLQHVVGEVAHADAPFGLYVAGALAADALLLAAGTYAHDELPVVFVEPV